MTYLKSSLLIFSISLALFSCNKTNTAEKLGYPEDTKLLIIHADDMGLAHSVNEATIAAFEKGGISSSSIMVPCPTFSGAAEYAQANPEADLGLHLTLTAEWDNYRWGGVSPSSEIPSLLDENGFLYATSEEVAENANPVEVEKEIRAQVERALSNGIKPTHLDSHMGSVFVKPKFFKSYVNIGKEYGIPVFIPYGSFPTLAKLFMGLPDKNYLFVDWMFMASTQKPEEFESYYTGLIQNLKPGLNEIIVHLAYDDEEMQNIAVNHPDYGAAWRQSDFDFFTSDKAKKLLADNNVILVGYRELQEKMYPKSE